MTSQLPQFRLPHLMMCVAFVAIALGAPPVAFALVVLALLSIPFVAGLIIFSTFIPSFRGPLNRRFQRFAFVVTLVAFASSVGDWIASTQWLIRHHRQNVATVEIGRYSLGLTLGTYYTADPGWSVVSRQTE